MIIKFQNEKFIEDENWKSLTDEDREELKKVSDRFKYYPQEEHKLIINGKEITVQVDTPRLQTYGESELFNQLTKFKEIDVEKDGNCYWRCIALAVLNDQNKYLTIKEKVLNHIFDVLDSKDKKKEVAREKYENMFFDDDFRSEIQRLLERDAWAGAEVGQPTADALGIELRIYLPERPNATEIYRPLAPFKDSTESVEIRWVNKNHYVLLERIGHSTSLSEIGISEVNTDANIAKKQRKSKDGNDYKPLRSNGRDKKNKGRIEPHDLPIDATSQPPIDSVSISVPPTGSTSIPAPPKSTVDPFYLFGFYLIVGLYSLTISVVNAYLAFQQDSIVIKISSATYAASTGCGAISGLFYALSRPSGFGPGPKNWLIHTSELFSGFSDALSTNVTSIHKKST